CCCMKAVFSLSITGPFAASNGNAARSATERRIGVPLPSLIPVPQNTRFWPDRPAPPRSMLNVHLLDFCRVALCAKWRRAVDMASSPEFQDGSPVPVDRSERRPVALRGYIIAEDGAHHEIRLADLSYEGCGIETSV